MTLIVLICIMSCAKNKILAYVLQKCLQKILQTILRKNPPLLLSNECFQFSTNNFLESKVLTFCYTIMSFQSKSKQFKNSSSYQE